MTLSVMQGHRLVIMLEFVQLFCCGGQKLSIFFYGCVRKMTAEKYCKYGEYGLFEHIFFLLLGTLSNVRLESEKFLFA